VSRDEIYTGEVLQGETPEWEPLLDVVGEEVAGRFMWMFEVRLSNGAPLHAYKHIDTRRYLHLIPGGAAFTFESPNRYRRVPVLHLLAEALRFNTPLDVYRDVCADQHRDR
jgi:hypothetical protein